MHRKAPIAKQSYSRGCSGWQEPGVTMAASSETLALRLRGGRASTEPGRQKPIA